MTSCFASSASFIAFIRASTFAIGFVPNQVAASFSSSSITSVAFIVIKVLAYFTVVAILAVVVSILFN